MIQNNSNKTTISKAVKIWLLIGLVMVFLQIVIGGITRLTGSGLSITEWDIVTGTLPPLSEAEWLSEFEKYKKTPQYEKINRGMEMGSIFKEGTFKFIYFWEYLHRLWARTMGFVFIIPFIFFYFKKLIPGSLIRRLGTVIVLSVLAASFGWIMVASGLVNRPWVNAYKLSIHLCIGISVFIALLWAYIRYISPNRISFNALRPAYLWPLLILLCFQIFLGGVMSGTKAALFINTWPDYHGNFFPQIVGELGNWTSDNFNNYESSGFLVSLIQFLHRTTGYVIFIIAAYIFYKRGWLTVRNYEGRSYLLFFSLLALQVLIGIITLINSVGTIPVLWGVLHQAIGVLTLGTYIMHLFYLSYLDVKH